MKACSKCSHIIQNNEPSFHRGGKVFCDEECASEFDKKNVVIKVRVFQPHVVSSINVQRAGDAQLTLNFERRST